MTSLSTKLAALEAAGKPIQVGLIGAGKFGSMFPGMRLAAIADLSAHRARAALKRVDYPIEKYDEAGTMSVEEGMRTGKTVVTTDSAALIATPGIDVILEVTESPAAGVRHFLLCCEHKKHIVMVNVEADVLAGPLLVRKAQEAGIIYSMAYGDQPALIAEMVDWARTAGFNVVCAGKGTKHLPQYHYSTPDTVWSNYGFTKEQLANGDFNPQMFNSFLDGTKSALEMSAVANGCGLSPPSHGLEFPPCGIHDLPTVLRPKYDGGHLEKNAPGDYQRECFAQYGMKTDSTGRYAAQSKPYHLIGLELGVSVANIMCRGEPMGQTKTWAADTVATAKRDLKAGEKLDGEGGYMVYGRIMPAEASLAIEGLPIGLAHGLVLKEDVKQGQGLSWQHVEWSEKSQAVSVRREMEALFREEMMGKQKNGIKTTVNGVNWHL
ncbi:hypothetical protein KC330_g6059 [Hortaea werneckii]|nr:hypothetical protein KC330_g6059 [Hortaea werneckii]